MKKTRKNKILFMLMCFSTYCFTVSANESMSFVWKGDQYSCFVIEAPYGKQFTVDWGDGSPVETKTGPGGCAYIFHPYTNSNFFTVTITGTSPECKFTTMDFQCKYLIKIDISNAPSLIELTCCWCNLTDLDISNNPKLEYVMAYYNKISKLDVSNNKALKILNLEENSFQLSELYSISEAISAQKVKFLGTQKLPVQYVQMGELIDFSNQNEFGGIPTKFFVKKDGFPAPESDYSIESGKITFYSVGNYSVTMTNTAIISHLNYPVEVIANFTVRNAGTQLITWDWSTPDFVESKFSIVATAEKKFSINWYDHWVSDTITGTGNLQELSHTYLYPFNYIIIVQSLTEDCSFTHFICDNEYLNSFDASYNSTLEYLSCKNNQIINFNASNLKELRELSCNNNQLFSLDVRNNFSLTKLECNNNRLTNLDVSNNVELTVLNCASNQLNSLDLSNNTELTYISCANNRLQLSNLYEISKIVKGSDIYLGEQTLAKQEITGKVVDFSDQKEFEGIETIFTIVKNGIPAPESDFTIEDGVITFHEIGNYTITMTNDAIVSHPDFPAKVKVEIKVSNINFIEPTQNLSVVKVYPNPASTYFTLQIEETILPQNVQIINLQGQTVQTLQVTHPETKIDVSSLSKGVYFVKTEVGIMKLVID